MEARLDRFGRIVLPKKAREAMGIGAGSVLEIEEEVDRLVLTVRREEPDLVLEDGVLVFTGKPTGDLEHAIETARRGRAGAVAGWQEP